MALVLTVLVLSENTTYTELRLHLFYYA